MLKIKKSRKFSEKEYEDFLKKSEKFDEKCFISLAKTDKYEIVSSVDDEGNYLSNLQTELLISEANKLGICLIYRIDMEDQSLLINSKDLQIMLISNGVH